MVMEKVNEHEFWDWLKSNKGFRIDQEYKKFQMKAHNYTPHFSTLGTIANMFSDGKGNSIFYGLGPDRRPPSLLIDDKITKGFYVDNDEDFKKLTDDFYEVNQGTGIRKHFYSGRYSYDEMYDMLFNGETMKIRIEDVS